MGVINSFLLSMSPAMHRACYFAMHGVAFVLAALYIIFHSRRYHLKRDMIIILLMVMAITAAFVSILNVLYKLLFNIEYRNLAQTFLLLGPLTLWFSYCAKTPVHINLDIMGPMFLIAKGVSGFGCLFWGCCCGEPVPWGIYSYQRDTYVVPMQFFEFLATMIWVFFLLYVEKKHHYEGSGWIFGLALLGYGIIRFVSDVFKDNEELFWKISLDGAFAVLFVLAGIVDVIICCKGYPFQKKNGVKKC